MSNDHQEPPAENLAPPAQVSHAEPQPPALPQQTESRGSMPTSQPQVMQQVQVIVPQNMRAADRPLGKVRDTSSVIILSIVTLGIYNIIWLYGSFESMKNYRQQGWGGGQYLLFCLVPILNVVGIAVPWLLPSYVGEIYREDGRPKPITGLAGFWVFIPLLGSFIWLVQVNSKLNDFWRSKGAVG